MEVVYFYKMHGLLELLNSKVLSNTLHASSEVRAN
jgi:hypothetical protein